MFKKEVGNVRLERKIPRNRKRNGKEDYCFIKVKKSSLVSGNRPGEKCFYHSSTRIVECVSICF